MSLSEFELQKVEILMEEFMEKRRPPEEIRDKVDLAYRIEKQSVIIYELRPYWRDPKKIIEGEIAKTTFVKSTKKWKIYWQRADLKWHSYKPNPEMKDFKEFLEVVDQDEYACFWG